MKKTMLLLGVLLINFSFTQAQDTPYLTKEMGTYTSFKVCGIDTLNHLYLAKTLSEDQAANLTLSTTAVQTTYGGGESDTYIEKCTEDGEVLWNTLLGGEGEESLMDIEIIGDFIYILGMTSSQTGISTTGSYQDTLLENSSMNMPLINYFIMKINQTTGAKLWGTYFRSTSSDALEFIHDMAVSQDGDVYIVGETESSENIATEGAFDTVLGESWNKAFLIKFDEQGNREWGTYYGTGLLTKTAIGNVKINQEGDVVVSGRYLGSTPPEDYFVSSGVYNDNQNMTLDVFLAKFSPAGEREWGLMFGGEQGEGTGALAIDSSDNILLLGSTQSMSDVASEDGHQKVLGSSNPWNDTTDNFLAKFTTHGRLLWSTYYGGHQDEYLYRVPGEGEGDNADGATLLAYHRQAIALDEENQIYIVSATKSISNIATSGAFQDSINGGSDAYIAKFDSKGERLWGTYFGGSDKEDVPEIYYTHDHEFFLVGYTKSTSNITNANAWWDEDFDGSEEVSAYIVKFSEDVLATRAYQKDEFKLYPNPTSGIFSVLGEGTQQLKKIEIYDLNGQLLKRIKPQENSKIKVNFQTGLYFVKIYTDNAVQTRKLIVH